LSSSEVIRVDQTKSTDDLEKAVAGQKLAAVLTIPAGYDKALRAANPLKPVVLADGATTAGLSAKTEISVQASRLTSAVRSAQAVAPAGGSAFDGALSAALAAWQNPPVRLKITSTNLADSQTGDGAQVASGFTHSSPGMILQFAVAGLLTCAQVIVAERKSRCLQRMLTAAASRWHILLGHYLAIFTLIFAQFAILILFGQFALNLDYFSQPLATLMIALTATLCIAALGLLIGVLAKGEEQAISFSLICMFLLAGLGGAWVPLELTGKTFQAVGHLSPLAWAMDGFGDVLVRGLGVSAVALPAAAMIAYALLFFGLARWRFAAE
jgi:ABC-2 type transport system permease protein